MQVKAALAVLVALIVALRLMRRRWWCACGSLSPVSLAVNSSHNSQHLFDPYSFTHVLHGVLLYALLWLVARPLSPGWRLVLALILESGWEVVENSPPVIERFRRSTVSLNYIGDSIANSLGDCLSCAAGFALAAVMPVWASVLFFVAVEVGLYLWIHDSLILAFLSLVFPRG